jgi:hypothetical protein
MPKQTLPLLVLALCACNPNAEDSAVAPLPTLTLTPVIDDHPLTELAAEAVTMAPTWLQQDLALALRQQDTTLQDELAVLVVDEDEPWLIDEIAFGIAHVSPEVMAEDAFHPDLLRINAEQIYARDEDLDYVELVEEGESGTGDWHTTTRYQVAVGGAVEAREIDRDLYYWYVVHPRIEDEHPWYIDGFMRCLSSTLECGVDADTGWFWREFLWDAAEDACELDWCPVLRDHLTDATVLWDEEDPSTADGAIASIMSFMLLSDESYGRWLSFGAGSERSIQPNRIYGLGAGNCGEWADMTTALSRTGLIANLNATPSSWDHTWNAFFAPGSDNWTSEWIPWEPVNWWLVHAYGSSFATYATRGDTHTWYQSDDYTDSFDMQVVVTDAVGEPVDGALISVWTPYDEYWWFAGETVTDAHGQVTIPLGAEQDYAIQVGAAQGWYPSKENITYASQGVAAGEIDVVEITLEGTMPVPSWTELTTAGEATLTVTTAVGGARIVRPSWRYEESYSLEVEVPEVDAFLLDADNLALLRAGEPFEAAPLMGGSGELALPAEGTWYLALPDTGVNATALLGELTASVTVADGEAPVELTLPFELLAGDVAAMEIAFE